MGIKFVGIGDDFGGEKYINNADFNIIKPLNNSGKNTQIQNSSPSSVNQSGEDRVKIEVEGYDTKSSKNHEPIWICPKVYLFLLKTVCPKNLLMEPNIIKKNI